MIRRRLKSFGDHLVADPRICHGKWTFRGTRVFVSDVLDQLARKMSWKEISRQWDRRVSSEAISETILLAKTVLLDQNKERYYCRPGDKVVKVSRLEDREDVDRAPSRGTGRGNKAHGRGARATFKD